GQIMGYFLFVTCANPHCKRTCEQRGLLRSRAFYFFARAFKIGSMMPFDERPALAMDMGV
ncbi:MAG: hypothetical protein JXR96_23095, partial [Deltaproteobacteria bacterium]|nr:hypothetical protein [Deltaproteobacteria bacterium]